MANAISILPDQQVVVLNDTYRKAVARKRLKVTLAAVVFLAALIIAAIGAEVNLRTLFSYFGNFVSYFDRRAFRRRARKVVLRDCRERRHETGRGCALDRRKLALLHALCGVAAGHGRLCQLRAATL